MIVVVGTALVTVLGVALHLLAEWRSLRSMEESIRSTQLFLDRAVRRSAR